MFVVISISIFISVAIRKSESVKSEHSLQLRNVAPDLQQVFHHAIVVSTDARCLHVRPVNGIEHSDQYTQSFMQPNRSQLTRQTFGLRRAALSQCVRRVIPDPSA